MSPSTFPMFPMRPMGINNFPDLNRNTTSLQTMAQSYIPYQPFSFATPMPASTYLQQSYAIPQMQIDPYFHAVDMNQNFQQYPGYNPLPASSEVQNMFSSSDNPRGSSALQRQPFIQNPHFSTMNNIGRGTPGDK